MDEPAAHISLTQRFFADDWLLRVWLGAFALGLPAALLRTINLRVSFASGWHVWLPLIGASLLFAVIGFLSGTLLACVLLVPLYRLRARRNGGPFSPGDMVVVLGGKSRGRRGRVYARWQGDAVRVELGEEERARFQDIFSQHQLLRR